jgi:hypothetical protein
MANHCLTFFFQQFNQLLLLLDQVVDFCGFVIEESGYYCLLFLLGSPNLKLFRTSDYLFNPPVPVIAPSVWT